MGTFTYDNSVSVEFDDRLLLHLQVVISAKLRRSESFMFTWSKPAHVGGRTSIWIDKHLPLTFDYLTSAMPEMNRVWIEELMKTTYRTSGLQILPESDVAPAPQSAADAGAPVMANSSVKANGAARSTIR